MAKKEKKSKIKVTEIPSKIKEIKVIGKEESELEKEIEESDANVGEFKDFAPSGNFQAPILKSQESSQEVAERPISVEQTRNEPEFSQTRMYSATGQQTATAENTARYISQAESNRRFNPSIEKNEVRIGSSQQEPEPEFVSRELKMLRGQEKERGYASSLDVQTKKPRHRYPWEE